jgi:four helix bundle protein
VTGDSTVDGEGRERKKDIRHFRDLEVYQRAFSLAMEIFELTKAFPAEEKYSMVDQVRRSSRSTCTNIAEGWRKRRYASVFRNKMTDAGQEASESQCWLEFAQACRYITPDSFRRMDTEYENVIGMLSAMENKSDKFCY